MAFEDVGLNPRSLCSINLNAPTRLAPGLRSLAAAMICLAVADLRKAPNARDASERRRGRNTAAAAVRWMRSRSEGALTFCWCCHLLDLDTDRVRRDGIPWKGSRHQNEFVRGGLGQWRQYRAERRTRLRRTRLRRRGTPRPNCQVCGKPGDWGRLYCSRHCRTAAREQRRAAGMVERSCEACGMPFRVNSKSGVSHCSQRCAGQTAARKAKARRAAKVTLGPFAGPLARDQGVGIHQVPAS